MPTLPSTLPATLPTTLRAPATTRLSDTDINQLGTSLVTCLLFVLAGTLLLILLGIFLTFLRRRKER